MSDLSVILTYDLEYIKGVSSEYLYVDNTFGESLLFINFINNPCELDKSVLKGFY